MLKITPTMPGSSPLARGLLRKVAVKAIGSGVIPARAGFTGEGGSKGRTVGGHPRSRGVYLKQLGGRRSAAGSSPLARGLHLRILGIPTMSHTTRLRLPSLPT